jgi:hypothetical protein
LHGNILILFIPSFLRLERTLPGITFTSLQKKLLAFSPADAAIGFFHSYSPEIRIPQNPSGIYVKVIEKKPWVFPRLLF